MPTVRDAAIHDLISALPRWEPFQTPDDGGVFIGAIGFEERASTCFREWCHGSSPKERAILITYPSNLQADVDQTNTFIAEAAQCGVPVEQITYQRLSLYGQLTHILRNSSHSSRVLVDLSSLASFVIYPLLAAVWDTLDRPSLSICYTESEAYFPGHDEWYTFREKVRDLNLVERAELFDHSYFQSRGVEDVFESLNFPGSNIDKLPSGGIVVPNFSFERVNRMVDFAVERYGISRDTAAWVVGAPPNEEKNGWRYNALYEMYQRPQNTHRTSTLSFTDMMLTLHDIWETRWETEALVIASLGSKAQHLATFLFLRMHPDVGLVISEPKEFNVKRFSTGVGSQWMADFGPIGDLKELVEGWNRLVFEW